EQMTADGDRARAVDAGGGQIGAGVVGAGSADDGESVAGGLWAAIVDDVAGNQRRAVGEIDDQFVVATIAVEGEAGGIGRVGEGGIAGGRRAGEDLEIRAVAADVIRVIAGGAFQVGIAAAGV